MIPALPCDMKKHRLSQIDEYAVSVHSFESEKSGCAVPPPLNSAAIDTPSVRLASGCGMKKPPIFMALSKPISFGV